MPGQEHLPDDELLAATAKVWELIDPPPGDLAEGVLARLGAEDLELELLTLVESDGLAGVRHGTGEDETGSWSLEYAGPDLRAYLRVTRVEDDTRLDGWVVPARPMTVELRPESGLPQRVALDEFGRFAFSQASAGTNRLGFLDDTPGARLRLTPPFWI